MFCLKSSFYPCLYHWIHLSFYYPIILTDDDEVSDFIVKSKSSFCSPVNNTSSGLSPVNNTQKCRSFPISLLSVYWPCMTPTQILNHLNSLSDTANKHPQMSYTLSVELLWTLNLSNIENSPGTFLLVLLSLYTWNVYYMYYCTITENHKESLVEALLQPYLQTPQDTYNRSFWMFSPNCFNCSSSDSFNTCCEFYLIMSSGGGVKNGLLLFTQYLCWAAECGHTSEHIPVFPSVLWNTSINTYMLDLKTHNCRNLALNLEVISKRNTASGSRSHNRCHNKCRKCRNKFQVWLLETGISCIVNMTYSVSLVKTCW